MSLTAKKVAKLIRNGEPGRHIDSFSAEDGRVRGLYLVVANRNAASWELRFQLNHRTRWMGLGSAREFNLKEARQRAREARQKLADKVDPLEIRKAERLATLAATASVLTFEEAAKRYNAQHQSKWTNPRHRAQFLTSLANHAFPVLGRLDVAKIETADVLRALEPIWTTKSITADRVRTRIEAVIDWSVVRGHRPAGTNPAKWKGHLDQVLPAAREVAPLKHHVAIAYAALPAFMAELQNHEGSVPRALEFLILNASRSGEVLGAKWSEIDLENATWTIPAVRMKAKKEHRVPLAPAAVALLRALPTVAGNEYVFVGQSGGLGRWAPGQFMERIGRTETVHGFRSAFRTWASEQTNVPREICERALADVTGSKTEQSYERSDMLAKRRKLMETWARHCYAPVSGGTVLPLRAPRS